MKNNPNIPPAEPSAQPFVLHQGGGGLCCKSCGRLEFFSAEDSETEGLPQTTCPHCGRSHDFDYPKCPFCGHVY